MQCQRPLPHSDPFYASLGFFVLFAGCNARKYQTVWMYKIKQIRIHVMYNPDEKHRLKNYQKQLQAFSFWRFTYSTAVWFDLCFCDLTHAFVIGLHFMCVPAFPTNARVQDFGANSIVQSTFRLHSWVWFCDNKKMAVFIVFSTGWQQLMYVYICMYGKIKFLFF